MNEVNRRWLSPSVKGIAVRFCAPCVPTWRRIIVSVAQADEVIIALPGDKCKMSIYEKIAIFWCSVQPFLLMFCDIDHNKTLVPIFGT